MTRIILASQSPARRMLLEQLGLTFEVMPSDIDEDGHPEKSPAARAKILARLKAEKCRREHSDAWIIACDTLVEAHDGTLLEKPLNSKDAERMMRLQSVTCSFVHSGICLITPSGDVYDDIQTTNVFFNMLTDDDLDFWVADDSHWKGRSGAFTISDVGQLLIERIDGDWTSVVGLPVFLLGRLFERAGTPLREFLSH